VKEKLSERWVRFVQARSSANDLLIIVVTVPTVILGVLFPGDYIMSYELLLGAQKYVLAIIWALVLMIWFERSGTVRLLERQQERIEDLEQRLAALQDGAQLLDDLMMADEAARQAPRSRQANRALSLPARAVEEPSRVPAGAR
jgi:hypothetical protein